ncbi:BPI fold-containing family B member 3-like [Anolis sagrei]|uniref:BPI fold-containing family B member 3-like n=1 Tax=Anolis sagrei TaxID=38937 RepID=UPI00351F9B62
MWKFLGVLVFCGLLSPALGTVPGTRGAINEVKASEAITDILNKNGLLENHFKSLGLSDIRLGGLLGLVGSIFGFKGDNIVLNSVAILFLDGKVEEHFSIHLGATSNVIFPLSSLITTSIDLCVKFVVGLTNFSEGQFDVIIHSCGITLEAIDIKLLGGLLTLSVISTIQQSLTEDLQQLLCPIAKNIYNEAKLIWLNSANVVLPVGAFGNLKFQLAALPLIKPGYVGIDLSVVFQYKTSGEIVSIPDTAVSIAMPSLDNHGFCVSICSSAINILLHVVTPRVPLELSNSPTVFSKAEELKDALLALVPSRVSDAFPKSDLSLEITIGTSPTIAFSTTGATVTLIANIQILGKKADGSRVSLVVVRCNVSSKAIIALVNNKVTLGLSLSKNVVVLVSSGAGITDVSSLLDLFNGLANEILLPVFNDIVCDSVLTEIFEETGLLETHLKGLGLSDIRLEEPHGVVGNIVGLKTDEVMLNNIVFVFLNDILEEHWSIRLGTTGNA